MSGSRTAGTVRVVGAGLLGASIGHGLRARGVDVVLTDLSRANLSLAIDYGAGRAETATDEPSLIVVAVPPDVAPTVIAQELERFPDAIVTDVASVKAPILDELRASRADISRYLGSHPLAGRERGGAISARADLFVGRPWVVTPHEQTTTETQQVIEGLILDLSAIPVELSSTEHDDSVALVSHVPQVIASLLAARLLGAAESTLALSGAGLRDTTRIASSDPELWVQILGANAAPVAEVLSSFRTDLDRVLHALDNIDAPGARRTVAESLAGGNSGAQRIPGKHGQDARFSQLIVMVDDRPGEIARLLTEIGALGVNLEDLRLEHSPGAQIGLVEISVLPEVEQQLVADLESAGWKIAGEYA